MRRIALLISATALIGGGVAAVIGGCGDDAATVPGADDEDGSPGSSGNTGDPGSSNGDPGTGPGTGGGNDGGVDGSPGSSGGNAISNPGKLTCGSSECDAGRGSVCCHNEAGATCTDRNGCDDRRRDFVVRCDEPADCSNGRICCADDTQASCVDRSRLPGRTPCGNDAIVCKTDADCGDAGACSQKVCGRVSLRVCGTPQGCN
jgi:hypothetical protein